MDAAFGVCVALQPLQFRPHLGGVLVAQIAVFFQRPVDDALQFCRQVRVQGCGRCRSAVEDSFKDNARGVTPEWQYPGCHLVQHRAKREEIGADIQFLATHLFGRHVSHSAQRCSRTGQMRFVRRARHCVCGGDLARRAGRAHDLGQAEIENLGLFTTAGAVGVLLLDGEARGNSHALETGVLGAEAMANSGVVYAALQLITERQRPLQGTGRGSFFQTSGLDNSFPSGHAIITWTSASTIAHEYPKPWVKWLTYGTATAVSVTRFTSLQHFPSDVVVGSTIGYLIGRHIFHEHCKAGLSPICKKH